MGEGHPLSPYGSERMPLFSRSATISDFKDSVALFRDMIIFFAILSYFIGWVYLNEYLSNFGLYLANLEISFYYYFIFSYPPLIEFIMSHEIGDGFLLALIFASIGVCVAAFRVRLLAGYLTVAATFLCILVITFNVAVDKSQIHANYVLNGGGKAIQFLFTEETLKKYKAMIENELLQANDRGQLRLVWRTEKDVYAVQVGEGVATNFTYRIPVSSFVFSRVVGNTSAR